MADSDAAAAFTVARRAVGRAMAQLGEGKDGFDAATSLAEMLRDLAVEAAEQRALIVARIYDSRRMSYVQLAELLGVSQIRARQLVKAAREVTAAGRGQVVAPPPVPEQVRSVEPVTPPLVVADPPIPVPASPIKGFAIGGRRFAPSANQDWKDEVRAAAVRLPDES